MKAIFEQPEINFVYLEQQDIICASCTGANTNITSNPDQCMLEDNG